MWPLKTVFYFVLLWGACAMALVNPIWGVLNYLLAYQTNPANTWWGAYLADLGMRFSMLAAVFTIIGMVTGHKHVPKSRFSVWEAGLLFIVGTGALSLVIGHEYNDASRYAFEKLWKMSLFVFLLGRLATTRTNLKLVLWAFVIGSLYVGYDAYTAPRDAFWHGRLERIGGPDFYTTSGTAAYFVAMLPLIGTAFLTTRRFAWRILAVLSGALTFNGIILCRTRSAFVGLLCGALVAGLMAPRARRYRTLLLLAIGGTLAFQLTDVHFWNRMSTLTSEQQLAQDPAASMRVEIWKMSLTVLRDHPQGVGVGNFPQVIGTYDPRFRKRSSHNTLVVCFTELGIHGGACFLMMVLGSGYLLYRASRLANASDHPVETKVFTYGILVAFVTYFVTSLGTERFYCESYWWILVLPLCLYRAVRREVTANAELPELAGEPARHDYGAPPVLTAS